MEKLKISKINYMKGTRRKCTGDKEVIQRRFGGNISVTDEMAWWRSAEGRRDLKTV
jgi:hypothetical protein